MGLFLYDATKGFLQSKMVLRKLSLSSRKYKPRIACFCQNLIYANYVTYMAKSIQYSGWFHEVCLLFWVCALSDADGGLLYANTTKTYKIQTCFLLICN